MQCGPFRVVSLMSSEAVDELGLEPGSVAVAVIKSTNVIIEIPGEQLMKRLALIARRRSLHRWPAARSRSCRTRTRDSAPQKTLTVFAAASLQGRVHRDRQTVRGRHTTA